jgi:endoglucanase
MVDIDFELLRELTETSGVPGYEDRVREVVRRELEPVADRVTTDAMGNVVGTLEGAASPDYEVAVAAHMDEIGFMVKHVEDGFLHLDPLGGWSPEVLPAQRVTVHAAGGDLPGVVGSPPPHTTEDDESFEVEDARVDLGLSAAAVDERVAVGDLVTLDGRTERVGDHVTGKALDDRICLYALLRAARRVDPDVTVRFVATVQEEVGLRGAEAVGADLDPDLGLALDVTVASDVPGVEAADRVTELGEGTAIKLKDGSVITSPAVHRRLRSIAEAEGIPHQLEVLPSGGTDTAGFQTSAGARPVGALSVPTRYLHTPVESAHVEDVAATTDLLTAVLEDEDGSRQYRL